MLGGLLRWQHVTDVGNDVTRCRCSCYSSTTFSRDVRLPARSGQ